MDKLTLDRINLLHPQLLGEALDIYTEICAALKGKAMCRFSHTFRSNELQNDLFNKRPKVTNARGGYSYHNYGLAIDVVLVLDTDGDGDFEKASWDNKLDFDGDGKADWMEIVAIFTKYGWEWGGNWQFKDTPHFQKTGGLTIAKLQNLTNNKGGTNFKLKI